MDLTYCIVQQFDGLSRRKHKRNTHLLLAPFSREEYAYFVLTEQSQDDDALFTCQLIVKIPENLGDALLEGEREYFKGRFQVIDKTPCQVIPLTEEECLIEITKSKHIRSNFHFKYWEDRSKPLKAVYQLKAKLDLVTAENPACDLDKMKHMASQ
jgi:hypothetical protein